MKRLDERTLLVIAGSWNPSILSPNWIGRQILGFPAETPFQVGMHLPVMGMGMGEPPRFTFEGLSITATPDNLIFYLDPAVSQIDKSIQTAAKILETLPHTPISAMGFNFTYAADDSDGSLTKTFDWSSTFSDYVDDPDAEVVTQRWQVSIKVSDHLMNVGCRRNAEGILFDVNHHFELEGSSSRASAILMDEQLFAKLVAVSEAFIAGVMKG